MKITRVIHQQIFQLRWQLLACLGLIMVLPLEEAAMNLADGAGFYTENMTLVTFFIFPFLAGLIACANVQADLDEKRYIFWMSKPVGVKRFITLKYLVGLVLALFILACPVVFAVVSNVICETDGEFIETISGTPTLLIAVLVSLLTYSLCFLCNVLVHKTARAWLIGMTATGFLLLVPFMLPLNFKDVATDFVRLASSIYVVVFVAVILGAFVVSLYAVKQSWHIKTNLKGLFWVGAGLAFLFIMMFSRQVANIKVLDEAGFDEYGLSRYRGRMVAHGGYASAEGNSIIFEPIERPFESPLEFRKIVPLYEIEEGLKLSMYPHFEKQIYEAGGEKYFFKLMAYYGEEYYRVYMKIPRYKKLYLCSYKMDEVGYSTPVDAMDISNFIEEKTFNDVRMKLFGDKLAVFVNSNYAVVRVDKTGHFEIVDMKKNALKQRYRYGQDGSQSFNIPLVKLKGIDIEEQVWLTIDRTYSRDFYYGSPGCKKRYYLGDRYDGKMSFAIVNQWDVTRYDVVKWDDEFIYCEFRDARPFTFLEQIFGEIDGHSNYFVQDGRLYVYGRQKLMVFDVRSEHIRKLGHFERLINGFIIQDIEVQQDGNIIVGASLEKRSPVNRREGVAELLYLLKNPE